MTNKEILTAANGALAEGNYEGFLSFCDEDGDWNFVGEQRLTGKAAVRAYMKRTYVTPPDFTIHKMIASEDYVIAMGLIILPDAQGRPARYSACDVWRFRDGKMVALDAYVVEDRVA